MTARKGARVDGADHGDEFESIAADDRASSRSAKPSQLPSGRPTTWATSANMKPRSAAPASKTWRACSATTDVKPCAAPSSRRAPRPARWRPSTAPTARRGRRLGGGGDLAIMPLSALPARAGATGRLGERSTRRCGADADGGGVNALRAPTARPDSRQSTGRPTRRRARSLEAHDRDAVLRRAVRRVRHVRRPCRRRRRTGADQQPEQQHRREAVRSWAVPAARRHDVPWRMSGTRPHDNREPASGRLSTIRASDGAEWAGRRRSRRAICCEILGLGTPG